MIVTVKPCTCISRLAGAALLWFNLQKPLRMEGSALDQFVLLRRRLRGCVIPLLLHARAACTPRRRRLQLLGPDCCSVLKLHAYRRPSSPEARPPSELPAISVWSAGDGGAR